MKHPHLKKVLYRPGLSMVELMVAVVIIAILAAVTTGGVVKYMQWQRDPNNPGSPTAVFIENVKKFSGNIYSDIVQKSKQEFSSLDIRERNYFSTLGTSLYSRNTPAIKVLTEQDPTQRNSLVYTNVKILRTFVPNILNFSDIVTPTGIPRLFPSFPLHYNSAAQASATETGVQYNNFYSAMTPADKNKLLVPENAIYKALINSGATPDANPAINSSAVLLLALENHPKGIKTEDLGPGAIKTTAGGLRYLQGPGGGIVYFQLHYVDNSDFQADKNYKVGSLRLDILYDAEAR